MRMDILKEFTSLARNLNFSTTARELYITQSTLGKHIALLEKELGAVLFARDSHKVELTEAGTLFLEDAAPIVRAYDLALEHLDAYKNRTPSRLRVGMGRHGAFSRRSTSTSPATTPTSSWSWSLWSTTT